MQRAEQELVQRREKFEIERKRELERIEEEKRGGKRPTSRPKARDGLRCPCPA